MIYTQDESLQVIYEHIASRKWWVFPVVNDTTQRFISDLERRYYEGRYASGFEITMMPGNFVVVAAFARKSRLHAAGLAKFMREWGTAPAGVSLGEDFVETIKEQDIISLCSSKDTATTATVEQTTRVRAWLLWVEGRMGLDGKAIQQ